MSKVIKKLNELKKQDASSIYVFRIGIFYNIFNEDAKLINKKIGLKLTSLSPEIIKCGFPISSLEKYTKKFDNLQLKYKIIDDTPQGINPNTYYNVVNKIKSLDVDNLTGVDALNILSKLKKEVES